MESVQEKLDQEVEEYNELLRGILKAEESLSLAKEQLSIRQGRIAVLQELSEAENENESEA